MTIDAPTPAGDPASAAIAVPSLCASFDQNDEAQQWLGCEGLHPLTWLPQSALGSGGDVAPQ